MSEIRAFAAIRYATSAGRRDVSSRLSPPYDVLDAEQKRTLLQRDPRNFVRIDLPHVPPSGAGPPEAYEQAGRQLRAWLADGTMVRDREPAIYVYHQRYRQEERERVRKMFLARLRLEAFGSGSVFPHERTFGGPKEDRLRLTKATGVNLSPILGLYRDEENAVAGRLEQALTGEALAVGKLDGVENRIWAVRDGATIEAVAELLRCGPTYIADGHHRYGTGLLYRDWLSAREGPLGGDHPANFVLCALCAMEDPGLLILPTHRVLPGLRVPVEVLTAGGQVEVLPLEASLPGEAAGQLASLGRQAVGLYEPARGGYWALRPRRGDLLARLEPRRSRAWQELGLAFLHAYLLERVVAPKLCAGRSPQIRYVKSAAAAIAEAERTGGVAFLTQATRMEELRGVCAAGELMPHKSTYFYPKLASGLVVNPLSW